MNKKLIELRKKRKILEEKYKKESYYLNRIEVFLNDYQNEFKNKESIEALKRISEHYKKIEVKLKELSIQDNNLFKDIESLCNHEIVIKDQYNNQMCPICRKQFVNDYPTTTKFIVRYPEMFIFDCLKTVEKFIDGIDINEDFLEYIEDNMEEFENEDVKVIRRR